MCCQYQEHQITLHSFKLQSGQLIENLTVACCLWGDAALPSLVIMGGISANRWITASNRGTGWWQQLINDESALNTQQFSFLSFEYLSLPAASGQQPVITTHDQAALLFAIQQQLNLPQFHAVIGASYGGMVALAFAATYPQAVQQLVCIAAADHNSVKSQAIRYVQRQIIALAADSNASQAKQQHLALARSLAVIGYRGEVEFERRFAGSQRGDSLLHVSAYLDHQGKKFARYFSASRYVQLSESIDLHQVDVSQILCPVKLVAIESDQMVAVEDIEQMQNSIQDCETFTVDSDYGHDGFLLEHQQLDQIFQTIFQPQPSEINDDAIEPNNRCASGY